MATASVQCMHNRIHTCSTKAKQTSTPKSQQSYIRYAMATMAVAANHCPLIGLSTDQFLWRRCLWLWVPRQHMFTMASWLLTGRDAQTSLCDMLQLILCVLCPSLTLPSSTAKPMQPCHITRLDEYYCESKGETSTAYRLILLVFLGWGIAYT